MKLRGALVMKIVKKNARQHNINEVMQELIAAGLHIDNEESLKTQKIAKKKRTEQKKKIETVYFT